MKFYLYPEQKIDYQIKWDYDKFFFEKWYKESYSALLKHPNRVDESEKADFYIVTFTLICLSFVNFDRKNINNELTKLPYWNNGKNHIVFDITDTESSFYKNENVCVLKTAFSRKYYNDKSISIPQFPRYTFDDEIKKKNIEKTILVSFKGHPRRGLNPIREKLYKMNDDKEIIIKKSSNNVESFEFKIGNKLEIIQSVDEYSYLNLLLKSRYNILPRGNGWALSYRHIEAMNADSIPVIISDNYVLPFSELIDWTSCSLKVQEKELENLLEIVKSNENKETEMLKNVKKVYEKYLSSIEKIINTSIEIYIKKKLQI
tara:strand:+ start:10591 stop:11541 length:951 start_codon:yes stop_codon:yes gene_type:complete